ADAVAKELSVSAGPVRKLTFHGGRGKYFLIFFVNRLLTIPTLGFYYFWGKIKERRYLHNHTSFEGDNFEYHARGLELLLGYFKISILLIAANSIQYIQLFNKSDVFYYLSIGISFLMFLIFYPLIVILTVRFRYSRTSWRGIRFSFRGAIKEYMKIYIVGMILTILTFGIYFHFLHHKSREYLVRNAYFGDTKFEYFGNGWDLFANYLKVYIMSVVIIISIGILSLSSILSIESGEKSLINYISAFSILLYIIPTIYWLRFEAQRHRYYWEKTSFSALNFDLKLTEYNYCKLKILNLFIFLFTLGLASPVIDIRNLERLYSDLDIKGNVDFNEIIQDARSTSAVGEAVEDALDVDFMGLQVGL
ncbi:MAG: DUF898 family protein, partial [Candidatus Dadabacteria bacterium]|nr:DUF898 family protein [Candidatus Dadabacteria bacterium]